MEKSLTYRRDKQQPPETAVLQVTQISVEVIGRQEKSRNSDEQGCGRLLEDTYNKLRRV
jgi:hypothetical protein